MSRHLSSSAWLNIPTKVSKAKFQDDGYVSVAFLDRKDSWRTVAIRDARRDNFANVL